MGGLPNHKFSVKRNRELTKFESTLDSLTKRLRTAKPSKGGKESQPRSLFTMPQVSNGNEGDSPASSQGSSSRTKPKKNGKLTYNVPEGAENIELHSDIGELICASESARQSIASMEELYARYATDFRDAAENRQRVADLKVLCGNKDIEIKNRKIAFEFMLDRTKATEAALKGDKALLAEEKKKFEEMKSEFLCSKQKEESKARDLEEQRSKESEAKLKKEIAAFEKNFRDKRDSLEKTTKKREESDKKAISDLEAKKTLLSAELDACKTQIQRQKSEMTAVQQKLEDMERLREVSDNEVLRFGKELERVRNEFALTTKTPEFYNNEFSKISYQIVSISTRYFARLEVADSRQAQDALLKVDHFFGSIPFSDSEESAKLREAHAQRVMTAQLCAIIWQPFSSDKTLGNPGLATVLSEIATGLSISRQNSIDGHRQARVWSVLASRALSQLKVDKKSSRIQTFIQAVLPVFNKLVTPARRSNLEVDLSDLAEAAISLWNEAQQDELDIRICQSLDPRCHGQWRSAIFEPEICSSSPTDRNAPSTIYVLFPRVIAKKQVTATESHLLVPGSFEALQTSYRVEAIQIHPGVGLAEWSPLVTRGKAEAEKARSERELEQKQLEESIENAKKEFYAKKGMRSSMSGPSGPSEIWNQSGGSMKHLED